MVFCIIVHSLFLEQCLVPSCTASFTPFFPIVGSRQTSLSTLLTVYVSVDVTAARTPSPTPGADTREASNHLATSARVPPCLPFPTEQLSTSSSEYHFTYVDLSNKESRTQD
ncbi:hypothetical protein E2C01_093675 [Portunus trituberculatus]|uniref:Uncharacterized protein n=1 Tax=Portunus trituberculatus TaxID=210409 RepID=A0A5B7JJS1_PORTR|nr:hypothetical protein [Portunus trituberculatus]